MSSTILYKFRSSTTFEALPLPGTSARLFDVKKGIVKAKRLESGMDFELEVHDASTNQQYVDESMLLPRGTRLIVHRVGAARGQGFVARMLRADQGMSMSTNAPVNAAVTPTGYYTIESHADDEDEFVSTNRGADERELAALKAATETAQNSVAGMTRPAAGGAGGYRPAGSGPPPQQGRPGGNFPPRQQNFRPNADPELRVQEQQGMPKKRATGIPRTFLNLSAPPLTDGLTGDGESENVPRLQPNALGFEELVNRGGGQSGNSTGTRRDLDYALKLTATTIPEHLQCGICFNVAKNAMLMPWDLEGRTACETCIRDALTQNGFRCPLTGNEGVSPDDLFPNMPLRKAINLFVQGVLEKMEDIVQQQVEEPDQDEEAATSKDFEGDTGEKGVIVSKKTMKEHRSKRHDDDDPFGGGDDDFGGDVFAVEAEEPEETDKEEAKAGDANAGKPNDSNTNKNNAVPGADPSQSDEKTQAADSAKTDIKAGQISDAAAAPEKDRRKQRALPAGYAMGPAGGATGPPTPTGGGRQDGGRQDGGRQDSGRQDGGRQDGGRQDGGRQDGGRQDGGRQDGGRQDGGRQDDGGGFRGDGGRQDDGGGFRGDGGGFRGRGRGGRGSDRGGYQGGRGREGRGGRYGGRGRFDDYDGGRGGYHGRGQGYSGEDRGHEGGYDDDNRGGKRNRSYSGEEQSEDRRSRDYRGGGGDDDWEGGGDRRYDRRPPPGRFDDRRGPPPNYRGRGRGAPRGRGYGRGRY